MVWFRNCNSILGLFFSCSVGDLTRVQRKETVVPIDSCARLVIHKIFSKMEYKYPDWIFGSVGESRLTSCRFLFAVDDTFVDTSSSKNYIAS